MAAAIHKMLTSCYACFSSAEEGIRIVFRGPDINELTNIVQALKTGEYARLTWVPQSPSTEEVNVAGVNFTAVVTTGHHGFREHLPESDGIVYVVDGHSADSLAISKQELESMLFDATLTKPILVLARSGQLKTEDLNELQSDVRKAKYEEVKIRVYSVPWLKEVEQGLQWLLDRV